jgi:hypothetical protein
VDEREKREIVAKASQIFLRKHVMRVLHVCQKRGGVGEQSKGRVGEQSRVVVGGGGDYSDETLRLRPAHLLNDFFLGQQALCVFHPPKFSNHRLLRPATVLVSEPLFFNVVVSELLAAPCDRTVEARVAAPNTEDDSISK